VNSPVGERFNYKAILSTLSAYLELDKLASPSGLATKGNPNWTVRIEGEVTLTAGRQNG